MKQPQEAVRLVYREIDSPIGRLVLVVSPNGLCKVEFGTFEENREQREGWTRRWYGEYELVEDTDDQLAPITEQLTQYFKREREYFEGELDLQGTDFQKRVWLALQSIPYGETASYKHIAEAIGSPKAVRAVGGANNQNPIPVIIPCHRIIGANGDLVGYGGGLPTKVHLLDLEQRTLLNL